MEGFVGIREFARRKGVSHTAVRKAILSNRITVTYDEKKTAWINPEIADLEWEQNTRKEMRRGSVKKSSPVLKTAQRPDRNKKIEPNFLEFDDILSHDIEPSPIQEESTSNATTSLTSKIKKSNEIIFISRARSEEYKADLLQLELEEKMKTIVRLERISQTTFEIFRNLRDAVVKELGSRVIYDIESAGTTFEKLKIIENEARRIFETQAKSLRSALTSE